MTSTLPKYVEVDDSKSRDDDDIQRILEAELDNLDIADEELDEDDESAIFSSIFTSEPQSQYAIPNDDTNTKDRSLHRSSPDALEEELKSIIASSAALSHLMPMDLVDFLGEKDSNDVVSISTTMDPEPPAPNLGNNNVDYDTTSSCIAPSSHKRIDKDDVITDEERTIITDLMELMLNAVEQCAPLCSSKAVDIDEEGVTGIDCDEQQLKIINTDSDIQLEEKYTSALAAEDYFSQWTSNSDTLVDLITQELLDKDQVASKQRQGQQEQQEYVLWQETQAMNEAIERSRKDREARRLHREQQMLDANRNRKIVVVQSLARGLLAKRRVSLLLTDRSEQQQKAAESARIAAEKAQLRFEENEMLLQRAETVAMTHEEAQCSRVWQQIEAAALQLQLEAQRQRCSEENEFMRSEELRSLRLREYCTAQATSAAMQSMLESMQQQQEEYEDLIFESDDESEHAEAAVAAAAADEIQDSSQLKPNEVTEQPPAVSNSTERRWLRGQLPVKSIPATQQHQQQQQQQLQSNSGSWGGAISLAAPNEPSSAASVSRRNGTVELSAAWMAAATAALWQHPAPVETAVVPLAEHASAAFNSLFEPEEEDVLILNSDHMQQHQSFQSSQQPLMNALQQWSKVWRSRPQRSTNDSSDAAEHLIADKLSAADSRSTSSSSSTMQETTYSGPSDLSADPSSVKELDFCVEDISDVRFLNKYANLRKAVLNVNKITSFAGMSSLSNLIHLSAKDNRIADVTHLQHLRSLRYLYLDSNRITDITALARGLSDLRILSLNTNHLTSIPALRTSSLQRLELFSNRITSLPDHCLDGAADSLTHLDLGGNQLQALSGETLSACACLQTVILSQNELTEVPSPLRLPLLKSLWLAGNKIQNLLPWCHNGNSTQLQQQWPLFVPMLQKLFLRDNKLIRLDDAVFAHFPLLSELDISFNTLSSIIDLRSLSHCRLLTSLHIQDNPMTTVRTATNGTVPLPEQQQQSLNQWLLTICPTLEVVSANQLDANSRAQFWRESVVDRTLTAYSSSGKWTLAEQHDCDYAHFRGCDSYMRGTLDLLLSLLREQNCAASKAVVGKREVSKKTKAPLSEAEQERLAKLAVVDWEVDFIDILQRHIASLSSFGIDYNCSHNLEDTFTSYQVNSVQKLSAPAAIAVIVPLPADVPDTSSQLECSTADCSFYLSDEESVVKVDDAELLSVVDGVDSSTVLAVVKIQKRLRGYFTRKRFNAAMLSIKYRDDELDALFGENEFALDDAGLLDVNYDWAGGELDDEAHSYSASALNRSVSSAALADKDESTAAVSTMVYGDHIRRRKGSKQDTTAAEQTVAWEPPPDESSPPKISADRNSNTASELTAADSRSRPSSDYSASSGPRSHSVALYGADDHQLAANFASGANTPSSAASSVCSQQPLSARSHMLQQQLRQKEKQLTAAAAAQEWGITDPKVLAAMMKRNKRMKGFMDANETRAQEKNPQVRLERFLRTAHRGAAANHNTSGSSSISGISANTTTSGAFGGKPQTFRRTAAAAGKKKAMSVPAWMIGETEEGVGDASSLSAAEGQREGQTRLPGHISGL